MRLLEHEAKEFLSQRGFPVPNGFLAKSVSQVEHNLHKLHSSHVAVKAQLPLDSRRKLGAVKIVPLHQATRAAADLLLKRFYGFECHEVLVEEAIQSHKEFSLAFSVNGTAQRVECRYSPAPFSPGSPLKHKPALEQLLVRNEKDLDSLKLAPPLREAAKQLYSAMRAGDAEFLEIDPLAVTSNGKVVALNAKMLLDDYSLFRHPQLKAKKLARATELERKAEHAGLHLTSLTGEVAVITNGPELALSLLDLLHEAGAKPACLVDLAGSASADSVQVALELASEFKPKVILFTIFSGLLRTDEVAKVLLKFKQSLGASTPHLIVRLEGLEEEKARRLLEQKGVHALPWLEEAIARAVHFAREEST